MDMITVSEKTLDEAITKALIELQTTSEHLYYEIVQKESSGFLGLFGGKPCILRARVMSEEEERAKKKAAQEAAKAAKAAEKQAEKSAAKPEKSHKPEKIEKTEKVEKPEKAEKPERKEKPEKKPQEKPAEQRQPKRQPEKTAEKPARPEKPERADRPEKKDQPKKEFKKKERPVQEPKAEGKQAEGKTQEGKPAEKKEKKELKLDVEKVRKDAKEFLEQVFGAMGLSVSIETAFDAAEGELQVMMAGDDMGILIGKRGQTLDSLQYLVSLVVNKETEGYLRVKLDTENYRERRRETLETLAKNISYKVKRTKHPVSLEPMNPYERRIIHSTLQNDRYVVTRSEGEDPYRHVVISLKKESYGENRRGRYGSRRDRYGDKPEDKAAVRNAENEAEKTAEKVTEKVSENVTEKVEESAE